MGAGAPDAATRERFLAWLTERDPELAGHASASLERLDALDGLDREGSAFARALTDSGASDEECERLLQVHAAWTRFRRREREEGAESIGWVGAESPSPEQPAVEWIEADSLPATPPTGAAPSLLAPGQRPRPVRPPKRVLMRPSDLLVPLALLVSVVAVFVPALLERQAVQELRGQAVELLQQELSRGARPERLELQAAVGDWLARARSTQLEAVRETCEGGPWCRERVNALQHSQGLARALAEEGRSRGAAAPAVDWRPAETTRRALVAELDTVARAASAGASDERLAAGYRAVVAAERSALDAAGLAP